MTLCTAHLPVRGSGLANLVFLLVAKGKANLSLSFCMTFDKGAIQLSKLPCYVEVQHAPTQAQALSFWNCIEHWFRLLFAPPMPDHGAGSFEGQHLIVFLYSASNQSRWLNHMNDLINADIVDLIHKPLWNKLLCSYQLHLPKYIDLSCTKIMFWWTFYIQTNWHLVQMIKNRMHVYSVDSWNVSGASWLLFVFIFTLIVDAHWKLYTRRTWHKSTDHCVTRPHCTHKIKLFAFIYDYALKWHSWEASAVKKCKRFW